MDWRILHVCMIYYCGRPGINTLQQATKCAPIDIIRFVEGAHEVACMYDKSHGLLNNRRSYEPLGKYSSNV